MHSNVFGPSRLVTLAIFAIQFTAFSSCHPVVALLPPINMGLARSFGAIGAMTLTSTGATLVTGKCGTCPGTAITGFPPGVCTGGIIAGGTGACNAEAACLSAYNNAAALVPTQVLPTDLGGQNLLAGVYKFTTSNAVLSTTLTLDGGGNPNGQFIFEIATTFATSATTSKVVLVGGAQASNVYFIVGSSATIGAASKLQGNILAYTSIAVQSGANNTGTLCALNGAVTLINNNLTTA